MALTLTVINEASSRLGNQASHRWFERGGTLGRAPNNDWVLPDPKMEISRCHARIRYQDGRYFLEDSSANGILLADGMTRLDPAEPLLLQDGLEFLIGDCRIRARIDTQEIDTHHEEMAPLPIAEPSLPGNPADHEVPDPLELLGGAVQTPPKPTKVSPSDHSYLSEHFSAPRFAETPSPREPPEPPAATPAPQPPSSDAPSQPLLPDDWWRDLSGSTPPQPPLQPQPQPPSAAPASDPARDIGGPETPSPPAAQIAETRDHQADEASAGGRLDQTLRQLLAGAGLDPERVPPEQAEELGRILRVAIQGVMDLLKARMEVKNEFRMSVTLIQAHENNPLKFSTSPEDALHNLIVKQNPDYLPAVEAFEAGFEDLRFHQLAMLAGMRSGFFEMLHQFDPAHLETRFAQSDERGSLLGRISGPKYWRQYQAHYAEIQRDSEGYFNRLFGEAFCDAYERQIQALKAHSSHSRG
jgi:type VI secretion system FHA domain protein